MINASLLCHASQAMRLPTEALAQEGSVARGGIHAFKFRWMPAFAGMTGRGLK
jgi:hypothetical protein